MSSSLAFFRHSPFTHRLENRTNRPHVELCSDLPLDGLIAEVTALKQSIQMLEDKLDNARETDSELEQHLKDLTDDHNRKSQALSLDQRCVWGFFLKGSSQVVVF